MKRTEKKTVPKQSETLRINKYLALHGGLSRRSADQLISKGQVTVNGSKITTPGTLIHLKKDKVSVKNRLIQKKMISPVYYAFHKPEKVLTTKKDPKNRPVVMDYFRKIRHHLFPIGRLDWDSEGLLLLTNDGEFAQRILHPRYQIPKTYFVKIKGHLKTPQIQKLLKGVSTPVGRVKALYVKQRFRPTSPHAWVKIIISEGKNRQIRRMFQQIGCPVFKLRRTAIGRLGLGQLTKGAFRRLSEKDIKKAFIRPKELY